jgi:hypothetical protein
LVRCQVLLRKNVKGLISDYLPAEMALTRSGRYSTPENFDCKTTAFQEQVRAAYLARAARHPKQFRVLDASRPLAEVKATMMKTLVEWLRNKDTTRRLYPPMVERLYLLTNWSGRYSPG